MKTKKILIIFGLLFNTVYAMDSLKSLNDFNLALLSLHEPKQIHTSDLVEYPINYHKWPLLHKAVFRGSIEKVKVLLEKNDAINQEISCDEYISMTALQIAAKKGFKKIAELLIEAKANVNQKTLFGMPSRICALFTNESQQNVISISRPTLLAHGLASLLAISTHFMAFGFTALHWAVVEGRGEVVQILLDAKADVNKKTDLDGDTALTLASLNKHYKIVVMLIEAGANVNISGRDGWTVLHKATEQGLIRLVGLFLEANADVNKVTAKQQIVMPPDATDWVGLKMHIDEHYWVRSAGESPLMIAVRKGHIEIVEIFLNERADVITVDENGWTAFHYACANGNLIILNMLLRAITDINDIAIAKNTPLLEAIKRCGKARIVRAILNASSDSAKPYPKILFPTTSNQGIVESLLHLLTGVDHYENCECPLVLKMLLKQGIKLSTLRAPFFKFTNNKKLISPLNRIMTFQILGEASYETEQSALEHWHHF